MISVTTDGSAPARSECVSIRASRNTGPLHDGGVSLDSTQNGYTLRASLVEGRVGGLLHLGLTSDLRCQLNVLQVGEVARDHPRKHVLRNIFGVHGRFRVDP